MPSDCPFREEVLREVEEMRRRKEDEKEERRDGSDGLIQCKPRSFRDGLASTLSLSWLLFLRFDEGPIGRNGGAI